MKPIHQLLAICIGFLLASFALVDLGMSEKPVIFDLFNWVSDHLILSMFAASEALPFFSKKTKGLAHGVARLLSKAIRFSNHKSKNFLL